MQEKTPQDQALVQGIADASGSLVYAIDPEGRFLFANRKLEELFGVEPGGLLGKTREAFLSAELCAQHRDNDQKVIDSGEALEVEETNEEADGLHTYVSVKSPLKDSEGRVFAIAGISTDITELESAKQRVESLNRIYLMLSGINQALVHLREPQEIFDEACRIIVEEGGFRMAWVGLVAPDGVHVEPVAWAGKAEGYVERVDIVLGDPARGRGPTGVAISEKRHVVCPDIENDPKMITWRDEALKREFRASASFPLVVSGSAVGAFSVYSSEPDFFDAQQTALLDELAQDISFAIELSGKERLREQAEERFSAVFRESPIGIVLTRVDDARIAEVNHAFSDILGFTREEAVGRTSEELGTWADADQRQESMDQVDASGSSAVLNARLRAKSGEIKHALVSTKMISLDGQRFALSSILDISERVSAEEALRESEQRFRTLAEAMPQIVWATLPDGRNTYFNQQWVDYTGMTLEESYGDGWSIPFHPDDRQPSQEAWSQAVRTGGSYELEVRLRRFDGAYRWWLIRGVPLRDDRGEILMWFGTCTDIEDLKQAEESLRQSLSSMIAVVSRVVEARDPYTAGHERRVAELAVSIAKEMEMSAEVVEDIRTAALVHDVGKVSIPAEILSKPGSLTPMEFALVMGHSEAGFEILSAANLEHGIAEIVYQHHERCDASGYPRGLGEDEILLSAKVLAVADVVEAMASHRPYRAELGVDAALAEIERGAGLQYDASVSEACVRVFRERGFEFSAV